MIKKRGSGHKPKKNHPWVKTVNKKYYDELHEHYQYTEGKQSFDYSSYFKKER